MKAACTAAVLAAVLAIEAKAAPAPDATAPAPVYTAYDLRSLCRRSAEICEAYIAGVIDGGVGSDHPPSRSGRGYCIPADRQGKPRVSLRQLRGVVMKRLEAFPKSWNLDAAGQIEGALNSSYPCR